MYPFAACFQQEKCSSKIFIVFMGSILVLAYGALLGTLDVIVANVVKERIVLQEGKDTFEKWKEAPVPIYFSVYVFNVTNPNDVEELGENAIVQEVGPFVFRQKRRKDVQNWDNKEHTVTYKDKKTYYFEPSMSENIEETICILNLPLLGMSKYPNKQPWPIDSMVAMGLNNVFDNYNQSLFVRRPARELLFQGYEVEFVADIMNVVGAITNITNPLPNNTFGFLYGKNNSGDGVFTVHTGEGDISKYTQIYKWNNKTHTDWWDDVYCDTVNGTDGAQFPPPVKKTDILYVFAPDLCRTVYLEYRSEVQVRGIPAYRFETPEKLFASPSTNPDNKCYCKRKAYCDLHGMLEITKCRKGITLAVTGPHFLMSHEEYHKRVDGLNPDENLHKTYLDIEPMTGVVLRASRKLQINYILEGDSRYKVLEHVHEAVIPLIWITEAAEIDDNIATMFISKVRTPVTVARSVLIALMVLGLLWIATSAFIAVYILIKQQKTSKGTLKASYKTVPVNTEDTTTTAKNEKEEALMS